MIIQAIEPEYDDCGEVNCTKLAEDAAEHFDLYGDDDEIPEELFEIATQIADYPKEEPGIDEWQKNDGSER